MNNRHILTSAGILFLLGLAACRIENTQIVKETFSVPYLIEIKQVAQVTVEITRIVPQTVIATPIVDEPADSILESSIISAFIGTSSLLFHIQV